jgi:hypothetical protein
LVFEKNANFFAENWQKSQKIVIITSTPGSNPAIASYSASIVKIYEAASSQAFFKYKHTFFHFENALAYYNNAGVVVVNLEVKLRI